MPPALPAQLGVDAGRAVDPLAGREDPADLPAEFGLRLGWRNDTMHPKATYTEEEARA